MTKWSEQNPGYLIISSVLMKKSGTKNNIMTEYFWPDSDICDEYEEISETEAFALIDVQRERYDRLLDLAVKVAKEAHKGKVDKYGASYFEHLRTIADSLNSTEYKILAFLHGI